jgi:hypothetical protein
MVPCSRASPRAASIGGSSLICVPIFGPDQSHSQITYRFVVGLLTSVASLAALIAI